MHLLFLTVAAQMWLFVRILPPLVGDHIPDDGEHWGSFLQLMVKLAHLDLRLGNICLTDDRDSFGVKLIDLDRSAKVQLTRDSVSLHSESVRRTSATCSLHRSLRIKQLIWPH